MNTSHATPQNYTFVAAGLSSNIEFVDTNTPHLTSDDFTYASDARSLKDVIALCHPESVDCDGYRIVRVSYALKAQVMSYFNISAVTGA